MNYRAKALQYVTNTGGEVKVTWFLDDFEPIGGNLIDELLEKKWITINDDVITLTDTGEEARKENE